MNGRMANVRRYSKNTKSPHTLHMRGHAEGYCPVKQSFTSLCKPNIHLDTTRTLLVGRDRMESSNTAMLFQHRSETFIRNTSFATLQITIKLLFCNDHASLMKAPYNITNISSRVNGLIAAALTH